MNALIYDSPAYRQAYGRINGLVIVGEGLADRHFRKLAQLLPEDGAELRRLGAMEARHARDFVGCGRNLQVRADAALAHRLLQPLQQQFDGAAANGDLVSCLVIQCLIIECFAVAAYRLYLPVADAYAAPITQAVLTDEAQHLNYGEQWLRQRFSAVAAAVERCVLEAVPVALAMLQSLGDDLQAIGIDPSELVADFSETFRRALQSVGFSNRASQQLLTRAAARALS